jgi:hypothetical protein
MRLTLLLALAFASTALAQETKILSVTPSTGPTSGGTEVTIAGIGFTNACPPITCLPPEVRFGGVPARETRIVNETTVVAITPAHFPGTFDVTYTGRNFAEARLQNAFTFVGEVPQDAFARVLLPIFTPPVRGAFGSEFRTELRLAGNGGGFSTYGLRQNTANCAPVLCLDVPDPRFVGATDNVEPEFFLYNGTPGRFFFVPRNQLQNVAANLRVADVSRAALNFGTEIPVVPESEFRGYTIELLGVPADRRFRNTLRIYSVDAPFVRVTVEGQPTVVLPMTRPASPFEPAYAVFTDFPTGFEPLRVIVQSPLPVGVPSEPPSYTFLWAFVTVTNNETQMITTITPQP